MEADGDRDAVPPTAPRIHVPDLELGDAKPTRKRAPKPTPSAEEGDGEAGEEVAAVVAEETDGAEPAPAKKKTRRGSRGGRNRKKPAAALAAPDNGAEPTTEAAEPQAEASTNGGEPVTDEYVPMSEWLDDLDA